MSDVTDEEPRPPSPGDEEPAEPAEEPEREQARATSGRGVREVTRAPGTGQKLRQYWPFLVMAVVTAALIGAILFIVFDPFGNARKSEPKPAAKPLEPPMETVKDEAHGFTIKYPKGWRSIPVPPGAEDLRLVVSVGEDPASDDGLWLRVVPPERIDQKINTFAAEMRAVTGGAPCGAEGSNCAQERVTVNGMDGERFAYTVKDEASGQENFHLQYFLRRGQGNLYVLVFQALPRSDIERLAPDFARVLDSFQTVDRPPAPTTSTTAGR